MILMHFYHFSAKAVLFRLFWSHKSHKLVCFAKRFWSARLALGDTPVILFGLTALVRWLTRSAFRLHLYST